MNRKLVLIAFTIGVALVVSACSSGHGSSTTTTPPTIAISTPPPTSLQVSASATIAATTTNDNGAGVDWSCTPTGSCGTFSMSHTDSAATTVYTAPSSAGSVTITAASTKDPSVTAMVTVTINPAVTAVTLTGPYTFYLNGFDAAGVPYGIAGNVVFDGAGNITGGEQDYFDTNTGNIFSADAIKPASGAVSIGANNHGSITITPTAAPVETLSVTAVNASHVLITEFDANATSTGSLDLQTAPSSVPTGGNAFTFFSFEAATAAGGVVTSDGVSMFTAGEGDQDFEGLLAIDAPFTGSFTAPDAFGRGTLILIDPQDGALPFAYYVVGPEVFRLVSTSGFSATGAMYGQGSASPNFSPDSLNGSFVFGEAGEEDSGPGIWAAAGQFTTDPGSGKFTAGAADVNEGDGMPVTAGDLTGATYMVKADGYGGIALTGNTTDTLANFGVYIVDPTLNITDPNNPAGAGGALLADLDTNTFGVGIVVPQTSGASFTGDYAFTQDGVAQLSTPPHFKFGNFDLNGHVFSDGSSTFTGLADFNDVNITGQHPGVTISGSFAADSANPGRLTAQLTVNGNATPNNITLYQASSALILHVDVDNSSAEIGTIALGLFEQQH
jgi:hypothetical protein